LPIYLESPRPGPLAYRPSEKAHSRGSEPWRILRRIAQAWDSKLIQNLCRVIWLRESSPTLSSDVHVFSVGMARQADASERREAKAARWDWERPVTKKHQAQEIVAKMRQVEKAAASGRPISSCVAEAGISEVTYYRWRKKFGNIENDLAEYLTELEAEIVRLRRAVSDLTLDKLILEEMTTLSLSPEHRSACVLHAMSEFGVSERRACQALGQHRSTQRKIQARLSREASSAVL
jgi:transposase